MKMDEFYNYLISNNIVLENQVPYYMRWVERLLQFCRAQNRDFFQAEAGDAFLTHMAKGYDKWQVGKASMQVALHESLTRQLQPRPLSSSQVLPARLAQ